MSHVFISYVHENSAQVDQLCTELKDRGFAVWRDKDYLKGGDLWKAEVRRAIHRGSYFLACFSEEYASRNRTYMNEELIIAIEELRQRGLDSGWFVPVKLNECEVRDLDIGAGMTLREDLHYTKLYEDWDDGIQEIIRSLIRAPEAPDGPTSDPAILWRIMETAQRQAEIALSDAFGFLNNVLSPRVSESRARKAAQRFFRDYHFRFDAQFTVTDSQRYVVFHDIERAIGCHYSQILCDFDNILAELVIGRSDGVLKWVDFLSSNYRLISIPPSNVLTPDWEPDWVRLNVAPFRHFELRDWYVLVEAHEEVHNLQVDEIADLVQFYEVQGWRVLRKIYRPTWLTD